MKTIVLANADGSFIGSIRFKTGSQVLLQIFQGPEDSISEEDVDAGYIDSIMYHVYKLDTEVKPSMTHTGTKKIPIKDAYDVLDGREIVDMVLKEFGYAGEYTLVKMDQTQHL